MRPCKTSIQCESDSEKWNCQTVEKNGCMSEIKNCTQAEYVSVFTLLKFIWPSTGVVAHRFFLEAYQQTHFALTSSLSYCLLLTSSSPPISCLKDLKHSLKLVTGEMSSTKMSLQSELKLNHRLHHRITTDIYVEQRPSLTLYQWPDMWHLPQPWH